MFDQPFAKQLSSLEIPILLISGEHDTLRASLEPAQALLKHGSMKVIPNQGPYICDQNPQVVADVIKVIYPVIRGDIMLIILLFIL
ncbi:MAG: alpha/beta hydrolase [Anaerolineales bacterium]|nr:alpha/beta hydrolase [Anaerolineales bacterium]